MELSGKLKYVYFKSFISDEELFGKYSLLFYKFTDAESFEDLNQILKTNHCEGVINIEDNKCLIRVDEKKESLFCIEYEMKTLNVWYDYN